MWGEVNLERSMIGRLGGDDLWMSGAVGSMMKWVLL